MAFLTLSKFKPYSSNIEVATPSFSYNKDKNGLYGPTNRACSNGYYNSGETKFRYFISQCVLVLTSFSIIYCMYHFNYFNTFLIMFTGSVLLSTFILFILSLTTIEENNVILTNICMTSKNVIEKVWKEMNNNDNKEIYKTIIKNRGNGEDLFFNFVYKDYYNQPTHVNGKYYYLDTSNGFSTTNVNEHLKIRSELCHKLKNI